MKHWFAVFMLAFAMPAWTQQASRQRPAPPPQLSTAEHIAIQACEKSKQDAQKQWQDAEQQELTILREWDSAHPGFHINQQTFAVEADPPKPMVKPALPTQK
jgi:hypothetical protein